MLSPPWHKLHADAPRITRAAIGAHALLLGCHLACTWAAVRLPLITRRLEGNLPAALDAIGFDYTASYSMWDLGVLASGTGGWDLLMASTYRTFILVCPLFRPASLLLLLLAPLPLSTARTLFVASKYLSFFYALEVMLVVGAPPRCASPPLACRRASRRALSTPHTLQS